MEPFYQRNRFLIYLAAFSSLYLKSLEKLLTNKGVLLLFKIYSWTPVFLLPIYIMSDIKYCIFDGSTPQETQGIIRRNLAFLSFTLKSIFYLAKQKELESLFKLWDSSFKEDLYPAKRKVHVFRQPSATYKILYNFQMTFDRIHKQSKFIVRLSFFFMALPGVTYGLPPFFSKTKKLAHPTGFPFREQSPDYEAMITYDLIRVIVGCCL